MKTIPYLAFQFITAEMLESIVDLTTISKAFICHIHSVIMVSVCQFHQASTHYGNYLRYKMIDEVNIVTLCGNSDSGGWCIKSDITNH